MRKRARWLWGTLGAAFAVFVIVCLTLCSRADPPIARGLPKPVIDDALFYGRVKEHFPIGSDAARLAAELRAERFVVDDTHDPSGRYQHWARYEIPSLVCRETWDVEWSEQGSKITDLAALYRNYCL